MYALIDCNNFYASCHRVFNPSLIGCPVVILSNQDGCVIARSNEAKALGIPMGAVAFQYKELFKENNVHVFSAKFNLYGDLSNRVMEILSDYSPEVEVYSIDEIFIKLSGFEKFNLLEYGLKMKSHVEKWTGIPISIGIAPTKSLAKVANKIAKKFAAQTAGVHIIDSDQLIEKGLKWTKIEDVWGIGRQHSKTLKKFNINTALDFTKADTPFVRKNLSVVGERLQRDLKGFPTLELEKPQPKKSIGTSRSFDKNYTELNDLKERIITFTTLASEKLRAQNSVCKSICVFISTNKHRTDLPQYHRSFSIDLPFETNSTIELTNYALKALEKLYKPNYAYKKAGVILNEIKPEIAYQTTLFSERNEKHILLMKAIDSINTSHGVNKVKFGGQDLKNTFKMNQSNLVPSYTSNINDIIIINAQ